MRAVLVVFGLPAQISNRVSGIWSIFKNIFEWLTELICQIVQSAGKTTVNKIDYKINPSIPVPMEPVV